MLIMENVPALAELSEAEFHCFLTGSRYFHSETEWSDYDFYTGYEESTKQWLELHGWRRIMDSTYSDELTMDVYRRGNVDVQLCIDPHLKRELHDVLFPIMNNYRPTKTEAKMLWNTSIASYTAGRQSV